MDLSHLGLRHARFENDLLDAWWALRNDVGRAKLDMFERRCSRNWNWCRTQRETWHLVFACHLVDPYNNTDASICLESVNDNSILYTAIIHIRYTWLAYCIIGFLELSSKL